jgi:hypothetical protein
MKRHSDRRPSIYSESELSGSLSLSLIICAMPCQLLYHTHVSHRQVPTMFSRDLISLTLVSLTSICSSSSSSIIYSLLFLLSMSTSIALIDASQRTSVPAHTYTR